MYEVQAVSNKAMKTYVVIMNILKSSFSVFQLTDTFSVMPGDAHIGQLIIHDWFG